MHTIICRKHNQGNADQALDLKALVQALATGQNIVVKHLHDEADIAPLIERMTANGYTCHRMDYVESYVAKSSINTVKAA